MSNTLRISILKPHSIHTVKSIIIFDLSGAVVLIIRCIDTTRMNCIIITDRLQMNWIIAKLKLKSTIAALGKCLDQR